MADSREDKLEAIKSLLETFEDLDKKNKLDSSKLGVFAANLLAQVLSSPKAVSAMQKMYQLPGSTGSILASPMEIYRNIGVKKSISSFGLAFKDDLKAVK